MKKRSSPKFFALVFTVALVFFTAFAANAQRANFSGDWKLDEAKSELGEFGGRGISRAIKVEQKEDAIVLARTSPGFGGGDPVTTTITLTYNGKVVETEGFGGSKRKSTIKWSDDGKALIISSTTNFERDGQSFEIKSTENWTVKDGVLSIVTNTTSPRGESTSKAIYTK
ncbi:MAG TPA: hypothetical protein VLC98_05005 [Phnomibacter sp.]|nr:hypothetical protein [Phnomibacter sp.]